MEEGGSRGQKRSTEGRFKAGVRRRTLPGFLLHRISSGGLADGWLVR